VPPRPEPGEQLAMVSAKITEANSEFISKNLPEIGKREFKLLLATVNKDGNTRKQFRKLLTN
jgi:hypothetical protein